jgi:hypothetical protein
MMNKKSSLVITLSFSNMENVKLRNAIFRYDESANKWNYAALGLGSSSIVAMLADFVSPNGCTSCCVFSVLALISGYACTLRRDRILAKAPLRTWHLVKKSPRDE